MDPRAATQASGPHLMADNGVIFHVTQHGLEHRQSTGVAHLAQAVCELMAQQRAFRLVLEAWQPQPTDTHAQQRQDGAQLHNATEEPVISAFAAHSRHTAGTLKPRRQPP